MAYPNIPGLAVTLNDLGLQIAPPPAGPKVTLLGVTSNTGIALREPQIVSNVGAAAAALYFSGASGVFPGELALAIEEAYGAGAGTVEVVVIGNYSGAALDSYISPVGNGASLRYADLALAYDAIADRPLDVVVPVNAWADATGVSGKFTDQLAQFCYGAASNTDNPCIGVIGVMPPIHWAATYKTTLTGSASISAALSGEVTALNTANSTLFFGDTSTALVAEWERYLTRTGGTPLVSLAAIPTFSGFLAGSEDTNGSYQSWLTLANSATAVNSAYWTYFQGKDTAGSPVVDQRNNRVDAGNRLVVIASPLKTASVTTPRMALTLGAGADETRYNTNGAAAYAGLISTLPPQSATTNKQIPNLAPANNLSASQCNRLTGRRLTCFQTRSNGFVVSKGVTGAHNVSKYVRSDFNLLSTQRIVDATIEIIRSIGDRFIGEPNTAPSRNALSAEIDKALRQMKQARAITAYRFFVSASPDQQVLGESTVDLTLVPAFELTNINVNISLAKEL